MANFKIKASCPGLHLELAGLSLSVSLTHDAVCAVGGGGAGGRAVVIGSAPSAAAGPVEAGHGRKAGAEVCGRGV